MKPLVILHYLGCVVLAACASGPATPALITEARKASDIAATAYHEGRHDDAMTAYAAALEVHRSIDNPEGIIRNLLNMAVVGDAAGRSDHTRDSLDAIDRYTANLSATTPTDLEKPAVRTLLVDVAAFRVQRALDANQPARAAAELARIDDNFGRLPKKSRGQVANLHARVAEQQGDHETMARHARDGITAHRRNKNNAGLADAHRLAGRAALGKKDYPTAAQHFQQALDIDRELARPNCVAADLEGLAHAAARAGDSETAALLVQRTRGGSVHKR